MVYAKHYEDLYLIEKLTRYTFTQSIYHWLLYFIEFTIICKKHEYVISCLCNIIKIFISLHPPADNIRGFFPVKLSHPMVAIPEHESLDSKEVNVKYNWRPTYLPIAMWCYFVEINQFYFFS